MSLQVFIQRCDKSVILARTEQECMDVPSLTLRGLNIILCNRAELFLAWGEKLIFEYPLVLVLIHVRLYINIIEKTKKLLLK